jgi:predicted transcriptional regulator of viral defense system
MSKQKSGKNLITASEVLDILELGTNTRYVLYMVERGLLERIVQGPNRFRYVRKEVEDLKERSKKEMIMLTVKPRDYERKAS